MRTLALMLLLLIVVTIFALSNLGVVSVNFWQWELFRGQLALVIIGAAVVGALVTYVGSLSHHLRQARQIRSLQESAPTPAGIVPHPAARSSEEARGPS